MLSTPSAALQRWEVKEGERTQTVSKETSPRAASSTGASPKASICIIGKRVLANPPAPSAGLPSHCTAGNAFQLHPFYTENSAHPFRNAALLITAHKNHYGGIYPLDPLVHVLSPFTLTFGTTYCINPYLTKGSKETTVTAGILSAVNSDYTKAEDQRFASDTLAFRKVPWS